MTNKTALVAIDIQNDFCPGGALAVTDGDGVVAPTNRLLEQFDFSVLTQDWHPAGHSSFASSHDGKAPLETIEMSYGTQVLWPDHCIQGSSGADFHAELEVNRAHLIVRKGYRPPIDSYSAFFENDQETPTGLDGALKSLGVTKLVMTGLATDFCVSYSALDARRLGYEVAVVEDAVRAIDLGGSLQAAHELWQAAGVGRIALSELI